ncbi:MAG TPA: hypothetical protein EYH08_03190 [Pyrodictium sp.]|nr:hypothetical protein [Pyrodictium sp.]
MTRVVVEAGKALVVYGPARVTVTDGEAFASGRTLHENDSVVVRVARGITFYSLKGFEAEIVCGPSGRYTLVEFDKGFVETWVKGIQDIVNSGFRRILVVGAPDTGKSTFSLWLYNSVYEKACFIESDVGQNELGLPGFVAASCGKSGFSLQDLVVDKAWFVGHVSADASTEGVIVATLHAVRYAGSKFAVIDTDGYVRGHGLRYKLLIAEAINADTVVVMGDQNIAKLFKSLGYDVHILPPPHTAREREQSDRRIYRERAYANLFREHSVVELDISNIPVVNLCKPLACSERKTNTEIICDNSKVIISRNINRARRGKDAILLPSKWARGIYAAIRLADGSDIPAYVENLDLCKQKLVCRVPKMWKEEVKSAKYVVLGCIILDENYREVLKLRHCYYPFSLVQTP